VIVLITLNLTGISTYASVLQLNDIQFWVGTGSNEAGLIIDFNDGQTTESFVWGYRWDGVASGADMLIAVAAADSSLSISHGGNGASGFFLSTASYLTHSETSDFAVDFESWGYYLAGGTAGDDTPGAGGTPSPVSGGGSSVPASWTVSPTGASLDSFGESGRILANESWDAWSFGPYNTSTFAHETPPGPEIFTAAAVPEPSTFLLLSMGLGFIHLIRRRK